MNYRSIPLLFLLGCLLISSHAAPLRVAVLNDAEHATEAKAFEEALIGRPFERLPETETTKADVMILWGKPAPSIDLKAFQKRGGGLVIIDDFTRPSETEVAWRSIAGASATADSLKSWSGLSSLFFTMPGRNHPAMKGISNFDLQARFAWNLTLDPSAQVMITTWTPHQKHSLNGEPQPYVYGVSPVLWSMENDEHRVIGCALSGVESLSHPVFRALMMQCLGWVGKRDSLDEFSLPTERDAFVYPPGGPLKPEDGLKALKVHPDITAELVAAEPLISKAINLDWDDKGRLWVAESVEYPEGRKGGGPESMYAAWQRETPLPKPPAVERPGRDTISWLEDLNGDGRMDLKHVFADGLDMVTSFCFYKDGVIVAQPPEILLLHDTNADGKADQRTVLYSGLGTNDTHAVLNNLRWGLDGWVYATHGYSASPKVTSGDGSKHYGAINSGVVRFRPDGSMIEMVSAKGGNCWGVDITTEGELFFTQPTSGDLVMHVPVTDRLMAEGGMGRIPSWNVLVHLRPVNPLMSQEEIVEQQPNDVIGSFTAACGCAIYEGGSWPDEWRGGYFTCEPTVHLVHHEVIKSAGVSFTASKAREEEFSATRDWWHRPIDSRLGPDGNIYVIDFYNQAILHNDPRGPTHLWNNQAARPDRDHFFGRIYRFRHKKSTALPVIDLATAEGRINALAHPNRAVRFRAQRLLEENAAHLEIAAAILVNTKGVSRLHSLWLHAAADKLAESELAKAITDEDISVKLTAARVMTEHPTLVTTTLVAKIGTQLSKETDPRIRLQLLASVPPSVSLPPTQLITIFTSATDPWSKAAVLRNAKGQTAQVLEACLASKLTGEALAPLVEALVSFSRADRATLASLINTLATHVSSNESIVTAALHSLASEPLPNAASELAGSINLMLQDTPPTVIAAALPLAVQVWPEEQIRDRLPAATDKLLAFTLAANTSEPERLRCLATLAKLPVIPEAVRALLHKSLSDPIRRSTIIESLRNNTSSDASSLVLESFSTLPPQEKAAAVESLLSRRQSSLALLAALDKGTTTPSLVGPAVLTRLQDHSDPEVKTKASTIVTKLRGATEARDVIIARLLQDIEKPGNAAAGKLVFAACSVCHQYRGEGQAVAPVLDGMGVHSPEVLLTHIIDPNREVEPSFLAWNVSTNDGQTVTGIISRETASSLFLKNATGEIEVPRTKITNQKNTGKSLMPEGFEALGAEVLRDLIAYIRSGEQRYHAIAFGKQATADGSRGVYMSLNAESDRVTIKKYGLSQVYGVPFSLPDPATTPSGKNVIVLKGGAQPNVLCLTMPDSVELPVDQPAGRLHMLGGVAGWGWPAIGEKIPILKLMVHYADGQNESITFVNGVDIADHIAKIDVPASAQTDLTHKGQIRYLWRDLSRPGVIVKSITLTSFNKPPAPMVAALTMESPDSTGKLSASPPVGGKVVSAKPVILPPQSVAGKLRVLLAGGGSSHDFAKWFDGYDQKILKDTGSIITAYTSDPLSVAEQLPNAEVFILSANDAAYQQKSEFRETLEAFTKRGGGLVLLHPATWQNWALWPKYNTTFVGGGAKSHDTYGAFRVKVRDARHPVMEGVPASFELTDELYHVELNAAAKPIVLCETSISNKTNQFHPCVWITPHASARIVCIALGHDAAAHQNPQFQRLLINAVQWTAAQH